MPHFTDQTQRLINLPSVPQRIISLVPSQTELLFDLGLNQEVIGITKFCVHPQEWFRTKTRIGGTKQVNISLIDSLLPDLIIANKEENTKEDVDALSARYPVWTSDIHTIDEAYEMIRAIGEIVNKAHTAKNIIDRSIAAFSSMDTSPCRSRVCYLIWQDPLMTIGNDTFIHAMLEAAGFINVFAGKQRYPEITPQDLINQTPDLVFLSSEPFPFQQKHIDKFRQLLPHSKIILVDGEVFSWYGSRMIHAPGYFKQLRAKV